MGDGAREEAKEDATIALARESAVSCGIREAVESVGNRACEGLEP